MLSFRPFANYIDYSQGIPNNGSPDQRPDLEDRFYIRRDAMNGLCTVPFVFGWLNENGGAMGQDSLACLSARPIHR